MLVKRIINCYFVLY